MQVFGDNKTSVKPIGKKVSFEKIIKLSMHLYSLYRIIVGVSIFQYIHW